MELKSILSKKIQRPEINQNVPIVRDDKVVSTISNWYSDRYGSIIVQRNILFLLLLLSMFIVVIAIFQVSNVSSQYTVRPFVIEVEDKTGITNVVNPLANQELISNDVLNQYFIMKYIRARESYCDIDYKFNYLTVVRLFSSGSVYSNFRRFVNYDPKSPILLYGKSTCTAVKLRSIQFFKETLEENKVKKTAVIRFTVVDANGVRPIKDYKIVSLEYNYVQMKLSNDDRDINPLGFQITNYKIDPENVTNE